MKKIKLKNKTITLLSDTVTPIALYLKIRDRFCNSFLLENSDYHSKDNHYSFICFDPLVSYKVQNQKISIEGLGLDTKKEIDKRERVIEEFQHLIDSFLIKESIHTNGFFGYSSYNAIQYFEKLDINSNNEDYAIPDMHYCLFKYIIQIDHFKNNLKIIENLVDDEVSKIDDIVQVIKHGVNVTYPFNLKNERITNITDDGFKNLVAKGKKHCNRGDVFQVVFSRQFSHQFKGDEFNVYRSLRSINPSPYLFYFDYGSYKLFGSSPESQIKVDKDKAIINPIAGTFKRTGNDKKDLELAQKLVVDPKENAEHTMLVDLARNDLSKHGKDISIKTYKEIQFYSHVIHLVSEIEASIDPSKDALKIFADTFPAGTLTGAPKYKAMSLIDKYENQQRGFYGGAIGFFGFGGSINHAITIRSFISKNNTLFFQAGAGIVADSDEDKELEEVNNKLKALNQALILAEKIS